MNDIFIDLLGCNSEEEIIAKIPPDILQAIEEGRLYPVEIGPDLEPLGPYQTDITFEYNPAFMAKED